jgi:hypothetical protein
VQKGKNNIVAGIFYSHLANVSARKIFRLASRKINVNEFEFDIICLETNKIYTYAGKRIIQNLEMKFIKHGMTRTFISKYKYSVRRINKDTGKNQKKATHPVNIPSDFDLNQKFP